jgi:hypothetical protein
LNENLLLRNKVSEIGEMLARFSNYIDVELFGEVLDEKAKRKNDKRFMVQHNIIFSEQCIINELNDLLEDIKNGIC